MLIGNARAVQALARSLQAGSRSGAYLLVGPERVGKATFANRLAQALNCDAEQPPCSGCSQCRRIASGIHADVQTVTVQPVEEGPQHKAIGVEQVREVERAVSLTPYEGRVRVVIFDPADEMTTQAQNAFLKTLEEPPPHVTFVLVASREERLLDTVRSRLKRIELGLVPTAEIEAALIQAGVERERVRLLARLARGRPGWALAAAQDPSLLGRRQEALRSARSLAAMSIADRMDAAERLHDELRRDRERVLDLLGEWQGWWRDVLLAQSGAEDGIANVDMLDALHDDARRYRRDEVTTFVQALIDARGYLEKNVQSRLVLEALALEAPRAGAAVA
jgi:DNA polymerase-3 subunit delta'